MSFGTTPGMASMLLELLGGPLLVGTIISVPDRLSPVYLERGIQNVFLLTLTKLNSERLGRSFPIQPGQFRVSRSVSKTQKLLHIQEQTQAYRFIWSPREPFVKMHSHQ